jgi:hypothetical protein
MKQGKTLFLFPCILSTIFKFFSQFLSPIRIQQEGNGNPHEISLPFPISLVLHGSISTPSLLFPGLCDIAFPLTGCNYIPGVCAGYDSSDNGTDTPDRFLPVTR